MEARTAKTIKERPILFSGPMVRAILEGRKTQTRRVLKIQPYKSNDMPESVSVDHERPWHVYFTCNGRGTTDFECPYGRPGDRLWVRESFCTRYFDGGGTAYKADWTPSAAEYVTEPKWKPSIHIPRELSRIDLEITNVRVERLQDVTVNDVMAEGVHINPPAIGHAREGIERTFGKLWDEINGKKHPWANNPWVWVIEFKKI